MVMERQDSMQATFCHHLYNSLDWLSARLERAGPQGPAVYLLISLLPLSEPDVEDRPVIGLPDGRVWANLQDSAFCWPLWVEISSSLRTRCARLTHLRVALAVQPERFEACICMLVTFPNGCLPWETKTAERRVKFLVVEAPWDLGRFGDPSRSSIKINL